MSYPGQWVSCKAGAPAPYGAVVAPDEFQSYVCLWPGKDLTLGRGKANLHMTGMDAWFPYGGVEWAASQQNCMFQVLVDDGSTPGMYSWIEVEKWDREKQTSEYEPLVVNGYSPIIIHNNLGKGSVQYLTGWNSYGGKETAHDKWTIQRSLVLCRLRPGHAQRKPRDWRELHVSYSGQYYDPHITNLCMQKTTQRLSNESDTPRTLTIELAYQREEGQRWTTKGAGENADLDTIIQSASITRRLMEANYALGKALYGSTTDHIQCSKNTVKRSYTVPPNTDMTVQLSVIKQSCELNCQATENIHNREGRRILTRSITGKWFGVTTSEVRVDIVEKQAVKGMNM